MNAKRGAERCHRAEQPHKPKGSFILQVGYRTVRMLRRIDVSGNYGQMKGDLQMVQESCDDKQLRLLFFRPVPSARSDVFKSYHGFIHVQALLSWASLALSRNPDIFYLCRAWA
jgi:hypothetical protein